MLLGVLLLFASVLQIAHAKGGGGQSGLEWTPTHNIIKEKLVVRACLLAAGKYKYGTKRGRKGYTCQYKPYYGSFAICLHTYAGSYLIIERAMPTISEGCPNMTLDGLAAVYDNATKYAISYQELKKNQTVYLPVTVSYEDFQRYYISSKSKSGNLDYSVYNGNAVIVFWGVIMFLAAVVNFAQKSGLIMYFNGKTLKYLQSRVFLPSLSHGTHQKEARFLGFFTSFLPTKAESVVIFLYVIMVVLSLSINFRIDPESLQYNSDKRMQVADYLAIRTGVVAFAHFPLIWLFGGRNNLMTFLTGFNFSTFIHFHKWTGRMMFLLAVIHSISFSLLYAWKGNLSQIYTRDFLVWGVVATCVCGGIMGLSYNFIRVRAYEIFLYTHIALVVVFTVGVYKHCERLGFMEYTVCAIAIWGFDRVVRIIRQMRFGLAKSEIRVISQDTLKVTVKKPSNWHAQPGQYCYVYFMRSGFFWQLHPFTVNDATIKNDEINFYVKTKRGITKKMYDFVSKKTNQHDTSTTVSIEGPYGHSSPNYKYDNIALVAGGNGIPGPFDYALKLAKRYPEGQKNIKLMWVARDFASTRWFLNELLLLKNTPVEVQLYFTREKALCNAVTVEKSKDSSVSDEKQEEDKNEDVVEKQVRLDPDLLYHELEQAFDVHFGRPDLENFVREMCSETGNTSITVCGSNVMCDSLRGHIAEHIEDAPGRVDYFEELQTW